MYKLSRRRNLIPFVALLGVGVAACMLVPQRFPDNVFEIPAFALFPAEVALVMMLSVLVFENATPAELMRIAFTMLALCMFSGGLGNVFGRTSQTLPDQTLLLNWVQLICMNITGLIATIGFYQTKDPGGSLAPAKPAPIREVANKERPLTEQSLETPILEDKPASAESGESVQEILSKLDVDRINSLESSLKKQTESVSLESLFAEESHGTAKSGEESLDIATASLDELLGGGSMKELPAPPLDPKPALTAADMAAAQATTEAISTIETTEPKFEAPAAVPDVTGFTPTEPKKDTLFDDVSGDLEDIFADLAPTAANDLVTPEKLAEVKSAPVEPQPPAPPVEAPVAETKSSSLLDVSDNEIDDIFASLVDDDATASVGDLLEEISAPAPAAEPVAAVTPDVTPSEPTPAAAAAEQAPSAVPQDAPAKEVKEFGRLSAAATSKTELVAPGTLKTIGQMLLDTHAIENIIKHSEAKGDKEVKQSAATARVVSVSRGADIQKMLDEVCEFDGVDGALVIGKDGLLIGATQSLGMMRDVYGVLALGVHSTTNLGTKKIDLGELRQSILRTGTKCTYMTEIGIGVLAAFSDTYDTGKVDTILDHISKVVTASQASGGASLPMESLSGGLLAEPPREAAPAAVAVATPPAPPTPPTPAPEPVAPTPPVPMAEPAGEVPVPITEMKGGLLNVNDDDIGGLFDNVLADPTVQNDAINAGAAADAAAPAASGKSDVSDLFDNLLEQGTADILSMDFSPSEGAPAAETPTAEPAKEPSKPAAPAQQPQQVKEFGRLSASTTAATQSESQGAIKAIGRQLIDVQAVENIIKSGEKREKMGAGLTTARVISAARGEGIKALLTKIDGHSGVAGSLIVGNDGLVIASTLSSSFLDKDLLGALCTAMHSHTDLAAKKLQMGKLNQIIFHAQGKLTVLTAVAVGVLAVFVDNHSEGDIDSLLNAIESTVRG